MTLLPIIANLAPSDAFDKSAFWKLSSIHALARLLNLPVDDLKELADGGTKNYKQYKSKDGRWIEAPKPRLMKVQRRIHKLLGKLDPPQFLFSGVKGRCAVSNASCHLHGAPFVKMDIRRFYPSSDGRLVYSFFTDKMRCSARIATILWKICSIRGTGRTYGTHLPTGGATSPILAYYCYMDMFGRLECLARTHDLRFSVLADDITFSGEEASHQVLKAAEAIVQSFGLVSNLRKRRVLAASCPNVIVTGVHITGKGKRVPIKRKDQIKELWVQLKSQLHPFKRAKLYQRLCGSLASAGQIEDGFRRTAQRKHLEWKADPEAWGAHQLMSRRRR